MSQQPDPGRTGVALVPASFGQRGLWLLDRLNPDALSYVIAAAAWLRGPLDEQALRGAFEDCVQRHESLRTGIVEIDGSPWQAIEDRVVVPFEAISLQALPEFDREFEARRLAGELTRQRFVLARPPLLRVRLIRLGAETALLAFAVHHAVCDGWSITVLLRDLAALYERRCDPGRPALPGLPIQFADFSEWQHEEIERERAMLGTYWRARLQGLQPACAAPGDTAERVNFAITREQGELVRALARRHCATPVMVLLTAFQLTLRAVFGRDDMAIAVPVAQRERAELRDVVGYVANTLLVRTRVGEGDGADVLLGRTREAMFGAWAHAAWPFDLVVQDFALGQPGRRPNLFQAMFAMQPALEAGPGGRLKIEPEMLPPGGAKADLLLEVTEEAAGGYRANLEYRPAACSPQSVVEMFAAHLKSLCDWVQGPLSLARVAAAPQPAYLAVCECWKDLFGHPPAGDADFFAAGGHSLSAARFVARLRDRLGIELPLSVVFENPGLADLVRAVAGAASAEAAIQPISRFNALPLSFAQARLWFMQQLEPVSTAYTLFGAVRLDGKLDIQRLRKAAADLQLRHEALRTKFREVDGRPLQVILPSAPVALPVEQGDPQEIARAEAAIPFDLTEAPLLRIRLVRLDDTTHVLLLALHHIVGDGWSIRVLWRDLAALYQGQTLPALAVQYADYAQWQKTSLQPAEIERLVAYWRGVLADVPVLDLPTDFPRPPQQRDFGARVAFEIGRDLSARLAAFARGLGATPFMVCLAAFQALLARYSGQTDIAVGVPVACRDRSEVQDVVGCFVNMLVFRGDLSDDLDFAQLVARTRLRVLEGFAHRQLPFERLVDALQPERDLSRHALFQVLFDYQDEADQIGGGDITITPIETLGDVSQFDLALYMERDRGAFTYRRDLFTEATIARLAEAFRGLLTQVLHDPSARIDFMATSERNLLRAWNETAVDLGPPAMLDALIAAQAVLTPDAPAIRAPDGALCYRALLEAADHLALRLRAQGAGPDRIVAVLLERGLAMPVTLLAILRAGAAYLPLDPAWPAERLAFALADAGPVAVVTSAALRGLLPPVGIVEFVLDQGPVALPPIPRDPGDLAYVIYTSGSTGEPKGAMIAHAAIVNRLRWMQSAFALRPGERVLQKTPYGFDVSVWEFFWPLLAGATMVVAPPESHRDPAALAELIEHYDIGTVHFVPSMLETFLAVADPARLASLTRVIVSGEALTAALCTRYCLAAGLYNLYGPTEAAVDVTAWTCRAGEDPVPIGRPIANVRVHVLDVHRREVPIGVPGEIYIGGVAVGRGYLNRAALTAERFIDDPFCRGSRLYRTGDRGRLRADGAIEYLGRIDHQMKLRGWRIEPGEIEAVLRRHPSVREAAVILRGVGARQALAAFVTAAAGPIDLEDLRRHAAAALPATLVPASIEVLAALKLSANGKLDRAALVHLPPAAPLRALPASQVERRVAAVWRQVLDRAEVGREDNFFELGGNSLLLVEVHAKLRDGFDRTLTLVDLFRLPTVAKLAAFLAGPEAEPGPAAAPQAGAGAVAIIGMAGRFPGAADVAAFWANLLAGRHSISRIEPAVSRAEGADAALLDDPAYVPAVGALDGIDQFDAGFFGITPAEAARLDPQGRLLLECAWTALEDAAIDPERTGRIGVFAGGSVSSYGLAQSAQSQAGTAATQLLLANDKDYLPLRISYRLGLRGPSVAVQTACSSSLVAVCQAVRSLLAGECDAALAGGVSVAVPHRVGYRQEDGAITSPEGVCRAFDAEASGTVPGNGVGLMVMKRLADAQRDGDAISAVITGVAVTNDGADKVGFTAPSVDGQIRAIEAALAMAGADPASIGFVEAHGTGTKLGDQVELTALEKVFSGGARPVLGAVKTNIGHLDAASGIAGLIKATLAVQHGMIPPTLHFARPHALMRFAVNTEAQAWTASAPRRAGVSSFGLGGTNAHVVIEQAPPAAAPAAAGVQILPVSARTRAALGIRVAAVAGALAGQDLGAVAWTLQNGRKAMPWRVAIVAESAEQAGARLTGIALPAAACAAAACHFLFPGQGAQRLGMGRALYRDEPAFRAELDTLLAALPEAIAPPVRQAVLETTPMAVGTAIAQPALFAVSLALARLLAGWGIRPAGMLGHSLGEFVAATLAGVFRPEDAMRLVALRGALMQALPAGAMVQVALSEDAVMPRLGAGLSVAAVNDPAATVVAGPPGEIAGFCRGLAADGIAHAELPVSHAFHSAMMDPVMEDFAEAVRRVARAAPTAWFISSMTGRRISAAEATDPFYWARHLRLPVRFADGLRTLAAEGPAVWLEVGPGRALSGFARRLGPAIPALPLGRPDAAATDLRSVVGALWQAGVAPDWAALHQAPRTLKLPTYPFERTRHWLAPAPTLLVPSWQRLAARAVAPASVALLAPEAGFWLALAAELAALGATVRFAADPGDAAIVVAPASSGADGEALPALAALAARAAGASLVMLTRGAEDVTGDEVLDPQAAAAAAAALVIGQETPRLKLRVIDVDGGAAPAAVARQILDRAEAQKVAIRGGFAWREEHRPWAAGAAADRAGRVILITGAAGRFGQAMARHLAARHGARLVLVSRRPAALPAAAEAIALAGDIADPDLARAAVNAAREKFGALDGVIHAAGLATLHAAADLTAAQAAALFRPKLAGIRALGQALAAQPLDFVLLCASLAGVLGGPGFTAYAAANRAMEAEGAMLGRRLRQRWISVAWDGLAFDGDTPNGPSLSMQQALPLLDGLMQGDFAGRIAAVAGSFASRHATWVAQPAPAPAPARAGTPAELPEGAAEQAIAGVWQELLGHPAIGRHDSFFALGGDSLAAIRMVSRLREVLGVSIGFAEAITAPTIAELAARLAATEEGEI